MRLIPIPLVDEVLISTGRLWLPFLPSIARRTKESVRTLYGQVMRREVWLTLVWDDNTKQPLALIGTRFHLRDQDMIAEWVWMTGRNYKAWVHLLPDFEQLLKQAGAVECRPICRPGWAKILKAAGYRQTHIMMEKSIRGENNG